MSKPDFEVEVYKGSRQGRQAWRWRAVNYGNKRKMASGGEAYTNKSDCLDAVTDLFSAGTTVHLVEMVSGSQEVLRDGVPPMPHCDHCGHPPAVHLTTEGCERCECTHQAVVEWM